VSARAVSLEGVTVAREGRAIVTDVDLEVGQGEFIAVLGPNGAGKSTLMKALLGLVPISAGQANVLDRAPMHARTEVGYLPQRHGFDHATRIRGVDLVRLGLDGNRWGVSLPVTSRARARRRAEQARIEQVISLVGAGAYPERPIGELSGGEQQRLLIAQALIRRPQLLILDEPLDSLDLPAQVSVAALIRQICVSEQVAVLLVAHDVNPLLGYLDRVVYLGGGRAVSGSVDEVITEPTLSRLYGAPIEVLHTTDGRLVVVGQPEAPHHHGHRHEEAAA
jgi:zinc/manganese transport system ATP-binding protein